MKISVIIATYNRGVHLKNLLASLAKQNHPSLEIIVADQNEDDRVYRIIEESPQLTEDVEVIKVRVANLSNARNRGFEISAGELIFFPDDDSLVPEAFIEKIVSRFRSRENIDFISLPVREHDVPPYDRLGEIPITQKNANVLTTASSIVYRRKVIRDTGPFDVRLGLGGEFEAAEDLDYMLRVLYGGFSGHFCDDTYVIHKDPLVTYDAPSAARAYKYNRGYGACVKKHVKQFDNKELLYRFWVEVMKNACGALIYLTTQPGRAKYCYESMKGKIAGFFHYRPG